MPYTPRAVRRGLQCTRPIATAAAAVAGPGDASVKNSTFRLRRGPARRPTRVSRRHKQRHECSRAASASARPQVGVYYSTEGGNTETVADLLVELVNEKLGGLAGDCSFVVDELDSVEDFLQHDQLLVGCPTWNTGADTER